jgi:hypothetical protein
MRLVLQRIPKNANSFVRAVMLHHEPSAADFDPCAETALAYLRRRPWPTVRREHVRDPTLTWFVVLRDPALRLVSAFLDKFVKRASLAAIEPSASAPDLTFDAFLRAVARTPDPWRDRHVRSQASFCRGARFARAIDLRPGGALEAELAELGLVRPLPPCTTEAVRKRTPYARFGDVPGAAATVSAAELATLRAYPTAEDFLDASRLAAVRRLYAADYALRRSFGLPDPDPLPEP